jgi:hypothetical protein
MDGAENVEAEHVSNSDSDFGNGERSPGNDGMVHLKRFQVAKQCVDLRIPSPW